MRFFERSKRLNVILTCLLVLIGGYLILNIDHTTLVKEFKITVPESVLKWWYTWLILFLGRTILQCVRKDAEEDLRALKGLIEDVEDDFQERKGET